MDDSFDEIIANMEMPEDPGPSSPKIMKMNKPDDDDEVVKSSSSSLTSSNISSLTSSSTNKVAAATTSSSKNAIQVNPNQKGNPLLKAITNIPWEFNNDIIPDYIVGANGKLIINTRLPHNLLIIYSLRIVFINSVSHPQARLLIRTSQKTRKEI